MTADTDARLSEAIALLAGAFEQRRPIAPVRGLLATVDEAYQVQRRLMEMRELPDNPLVGRKVGLTSAAVQEQLGVDQPDFGILLRDMEVPHDGIVDLGRLIQPKVEAEVAFVLGHDVLGTEREAVLSAVEWVAPAIEIVDSRIERWQIALVDTVADNASSAMFVLGNDRVRPEDLDLKAVTMSMTLNGAVVSSGSGKDCLGDPVEALLWVARTAAEQGRPLTAGEVVLSGALGPMAPLSVGDAVEATFSELGSVRVFGGTTT